MNALEMIEKEVENNNICHAYLLIAGDRLLLENIVGHFISKTDCLKEDVSIVDQDENQSMNKSSEITIESIRAFIHDLALSPHGKLRIGIIKGAERLNKSSANILLKTLEEPPGNVIIILTSITPNIIATIQSRCRVIRFNSEIQASSNTFSYQEFLEQPFYKNVQEIEKIVKENQIQLFLSDLIASIDVDLRHNCSTISANNLIKLIGAQKRIKANVNPRLVLENLILSMKAENER